MDFESAIFETSIAYTLNKRFQVGCELRLIGYYGGVLDRLPHGGMMFLTSPMAGVSLSQITLCMSMHQLINGISCI